MSKLSCLSPSNWACHQKTTRSQIAAFQLGLPPKNLEFPDCSCSPVAFQLGLPPKNLEFPDCSCSPVAVQLGLPPTKHEFPDCSCSPVAFQLGLPSSQIAVLQLAITDTIDRRINKFLLSGFISIYCIGAV